MSNTNIFELVITLLFVVSELLAYIPAVKANSVFQLIVTIIQAVSGKGTILNPPTKPSV